VGVFSPVGSSQISVTLSGAANPTVTNVALVANTETSISLPANTKQYLLKLRDATAPLQVAFISGQSSTTYLTVPRGTFYADSGLQTSVTIYCQTPASGQTLELLTWT
jgi:hypothetical protein